MFLFFFSILAAYAHYSTIILKGREMSTYITAKCLHLAFKGMRFPYGRFVYIHYAICSVLCLYYNTVHSWCTLYETGPGFYKGFVCT